MSLFNLDYEIIGTKIDHLKYFLTNSIYAPPPPKRPCITKIYLDTIKIGILTSETKLTLFMEGADFTPTSVFYL